MAAPEEDLLAGTKYRVLGLIGKGGMGRVYEVEHLELGKQFVVKVLSDQHAADPAFVERARFEAQALAQLSHANIVSVSDMGRLRNGSPFIVMERLQGRTLGQELDARGRLGVLEAIGRVRELLSALAEAHAIGIVHRDVKLDNLFLHEPPNGERILKVLDFGVAKALPGVSERTPEPPAFPTEEGVRVGTPRFISPEAARGQRVDGRADLYSTGVVLYVLLTGKHPFGDVRGADAMAAAHAWRAPEPPSRLASDPVPPELDRLLLRALAKSPDDRFPSARDFDRALAQVEEALRRPAGWLETSVFDPEKLDAIVAAKAKAARAARGHGPVEVDAAPREGATQPEVPAKVLPFADTQPSADVPQSSPVPEQPPAPAAHESERPAGRGRITVVAMALLVLSAVVVVVASVLLSR